MRTRRIVSKQSPGPGAGAPPARYEDLIPAMSSLSSISISQIGSKEGEPGYCPRNRAPQNPDEIALPTSSEVNLENI